MIGKIFRIAIVSVAIVLVGAALLVHTSFFRAQALELLESRLNETLHGRIELGALEGILLHRATLRNVVLRDASGRPVLEIDAVRVDPDIASLIIDHVLRLDRVQVVRPRLYLRADAHGRLNIAEIFGSGTSTASAGGGYTPLPIEVASARILDGYVSYAAPDAAAQEIRAIDLWARASIREDRIDARVADLGFEPSAYPSRLELSGSTSIRPDQLALSAFHFRDRLGSSGRIDELMVRAGDVRARFELTADSRSLSALTGASGLSGTIGLLGGVEHTGGAPWYLDARGWLGERNTPLSLTATAGANLDRLKLGLAVKGPVDPSALYDQAPAGALEGAISVDVEGTTLAELTGRAHARLSGRLRYSEDVPALDVRAFELTASAKDHRFAAGGRLESTVARARFGLAGALVKGRFALAPSEVHLVVRDLRAVMPPSARVSGSLSVDAKASGELPSLMGTAGIEATDLAVGDVSVPHLALRIRSASHGGERARLTIGRLAATLFGRSWRAEGSPVVEAQSQPAGWQVQVRDLVLAGSAGRIELNANADLGRKRLRSAKVEISNLDPTYIRTVLGAGHTRVPGRVSVNAKLDGRSARVTASLAGSKIGRATLDARARLPVRTLDPAAYRGFGLGAIERARITLQQLDVPAVLGVAGVETVERGRLTGDLSMLDGGRRLVGRIDLEDARLASLGPDQSIALHVQIPEQGDLIGQIVGRYRGRRALFAAFNVSTMPPRRILQRGVSALSELQGTVQARFDRFPIAGTSTTSRPSSVSGRATLAKHAGRIDLDLDASGAPPKLPEMKVKMKAQLSGRRLSARGSVDAGPAGRATLAATVRTPADPYAIDAWRTLTPKAVQSAKVEVSGVELAAWTRAITSGRLNARLDLVEGKGMVDVADLVAPPLAEPLAMTATITSSGGRTAVRGRVAEATRSVLEFKAAVPRVLRRLIEMSPSQLTRLPVTGELHADAFPLELFQQLFDANEQISGALAIDGKLSGSLDDPLFTADLSSNDASVHSTVFTAIQAHVELTRAALAANVRMDEKAGGELHLETSLGLGRDRAVVGRLHAARFDLDFLSLLASKTRGTLGGVAGNLEADLSLSGTREDPHFEGRVEVKELRAILQYPVPPIEHTTIDLRFAGDDAIYGVEGRSGDGSFQLTGHGHLPALTQPNLTGSLKLDDLTLAAGPRLVKTDLQVDYRVETKDGLITGEAVITKGSAKIESGAKDVAPIERFDNVAIVQHLGQEVGPGPVEAREQASSGPPPVQMRFHVKTKGAIPLHSDELDASAKIDLTIETSPEGLIAKGGVSVGEGTIQLFGGRSWYIERADITFPGGSAKEPELNVRIYHDFETVVVYVNVDGTPSSPKLELTSDPGGYTREQLLGFVLGGSPDASQSDAALGEQAAGAAAGFLVGQIQNQIKSRLPIDTLSVGVGDGARASGVLVGKWITQRIFVAYNYRIGADVDQNTNEGIVRVLFGYGWMLEASYGDRGNGGADILWTTRF